MQDMRDTAQGENEIKKAVPYVALLRSEEPPSLFAEALALFLQALNRTLIYVHPQDVHPDSHMVEGQTFDGTDWKWRQAEMPVLFDAAPTALDSPDAPSSLGEYLRKNACLIEYGQMSNSALQKLLSESEGFSQFSLWTRDLTDAGTLFDAVRKHGKVIVKQDNNEGCGKILLVEQHESGTAFVVRSEGGGGCRC